MENIRPFNKRGLSSAHDPHPHPAKRQCTGPFKSVLMPEHATMIESFVASMTRDLKEAVRRAYDEDMRIMVSVLNTAEERSDCSRFCKRVQTILDHAIDSMGTTLVGDLVPETPRYHDWYRGWLYQRPRLLTWTTERHSSPGAILASIENPRAPVGPMVVDNPIVTWGLDVRSQPAPPSHNGQIHKYAKAMRKSLGEAIVRDFQAAAAEARVRGIRFEECKHKGKPPAEVVKEKFDCLNRMITEFESAWAARRQCPTLEEVNGWFNKRRSLVEFPQIVPVPSIELGDAEDESGDMPMPDEPLPQIPEEPLQEVTERDWKREENTLPCHCSKLDIKRKKFACRRCFCSTRGFPCSTGGCGCSNIEICGNPFNNIERIMGPAADSPHQLHECFITWLGGRPYTAKPQPQRVDMKWLFDKIYFELTCGKAIEDDQALRAWNDRWKTLDQPQPGTEAEKHRHMQQLVAMALAREYPGRQYFFSFCVDRFKDQLGAWVREDEYRHCSSCTGCRKMDTWHCKKCSRCSEGKAVPCSTCGGVSRAFHSLEKLSRDVKEEANRT
ncbi:hypothetical protein F4809DRAFT_610414 [Biscogniauxia mediterranea]|nr:hypothetical protein F4809DRAFT_610414 [Biscogniauxia mediterranea]